MKVLVIGAHHGVGAQVMRVGGARNVTMTAFEGDVLDADAVTRAVERQDAIVSTLGPRKGSAPDLCSRGTGNIVAAMKIQGLRRLVQVTGAMIGHPKDKLGLVYRLISSIVPDSQLADRRLQEEIVVKSDLDWTLIRPTRLTDDPPRGRWRAADSERIGAFAKISRADVADAIMRAVTSADAIGQAWTLQY